MFACYDRVVVISLPERKDRRRAMRRELGSVPFEFFDAYRINRPGLFTSPGAFGCTLSHVQVLSEAAHANESVLILEDDCVLSQSAWCYKPTNDILWAGWEQRNDRDVIGAQCIGYTARAARLASTYIRNLLDPAHPPEPTAAAEPEFNPRIRPPYDGCLVWFLRSHPEISSEFISLTRQRPSRSDITPSRLDRIPGLSPFVELARRQRRAERQAMVDRIFD